MGWSRATVVSVAKRTGYPVVEAWSSHNAGIMGTVYGPLLHHTGSTNPTGADYPTLKVVRDGRAGLENSLCMYGLGKSGTIYCVSEKISWHAGVGKWNGITDGNGHFAGIEAESSGNGKDWTPQQLDSYKKLCASILRETGRGTEWMAAHREFALPPGRKPDPTGIDMAAFRREVGILIANPGGGDDDDMPYRNWSQDDKNALLNDIRELAVSPVLGRTWNVPVAANGEVKNGEPWASSRLAGIDVKTGSIEQVLASLTASVAALAEKQGGGVTAEEFKRLLAESIINVDVDINGKDV